MLSFRQAFLILGLLAFANVAQATPIVVDGDHFSVTYDDALVDPLYLSGAMSGSQDTLYFQPNAFMAFGVGSPESTQAALQFSVTIHSGYAFGGLSFSEWGNYFLSDGGSANAAASVQATNIATSATSILNLVPGTSLDVIGDSVTWELSGLIAPLGLGSPQTLLVTLNNQIGVAPTVDGLGFIEKNYVGFRIMTLSQPQAVPEPSTWALLVAGMLAALLAGRRHMRVTRKG